jgi:hypothetical protein
MDDNDDVGRLIEHCQGIQRERDALRAENLRLRAVLRKICLLDGEPDSLTQIFDEVHREMDSWHA